MPLSVRAQRVEHVRLAAALVHALYRATLIVDVVDEQPQRRLRVGRDPDADLDPCGFRSAVANAWRTGVPDLSRTLAIGEVSGSVFDIGGGVLRSRTTDERWFATLLAPHRTRALLEAAPPDLDVTEIRAGIMPDRMLEVSVVNVRPLHGRRSAEQLDAAASWSFSACLAEELTCLPAGAYDGIDCTDLGGATAESG